MKSNLLTLSVLTLLTTGCIPRTPYDTTGDNTRQYNNRQYNSQQYENRQYNTRQYDREQRVYSAPIPVAQAPREYVQQTQQVVATPAPTNVSYSTMQTIQGPKLTVGIHPTGFIFPNYRGKVVLLQIFGKECPHCMNEMPVINQLRAKYRDRFQVVAVQAQDPMSRQESSQIINRFQMYYPIIEKNSANDILVALKQTYNWRGILPYGLLIKNGIVEYTYSGETTDEEVQEMDEIIRG